MARKLKGADDARSRCSDLRVEIWILAWKVIRVERVRQLRKRARTMAANGALGSGGNSLD